MREVFRKDVTQLFIQRQYFRFANRFHNSKAMLKREEIFYLGTVQTTSALGGKPNSDIVTDEVDHDVDGRDGDDDDDDVDGRRRQSRENI